MSTRVNHDRPRLHPPTVAALSDEWAALNVELATTTDADEQARLRDELARVEAEAARLIEQQDTTP